MTLMALQSTQTCLEKVQLCGVPTVPDTAILMLSTFQSITTRVLRSKRSTPLDLQPLRVLPQLTNLALRTGRFLGPEAAAQLTALSLSQAEAVCVHDCRCVTALVKLSLSCSTLLCFQSRNVAACSRLQSLVLCQASISSGSVEEDFTFLDEDNAKIPSGLSALTALTSLELETPTCQLLDWPTALTALQSFQLEVGQAIFPVSWNSMTGLKNLVVNIHYDGWVEEQPNVNIHYDGWVEEQPNVCFDFDWC